MLTECGDMGMYTIWCSRCPCKDIKKIAIHDEGIWYQCPDCGAMKFLPYQQDKHADIPS